jgi:hypothetical protein
MSAPTMPGVEAAIRSRSTSGSIGTERVWTSRIRRRPRRSGGRTGMRRSKRPGRSSAGSRISGRLVAAITMTPIAGSNPSISVRIWLSVCSRSSWPPWMPALALRARPIASSSSMKTIAGAFALASLKRSRTRDAPTPTMTSTNSLAEIEKNGTPASPATARASSVLPVPGWPLRSTPRGIFAPSRRYLSGCLRKSTISISSSSASSMPATSANVTRCSASSERRAFERPSEASIPPGCARRMSMISRPTNSSVGPKLSRIVTSSGRSDVIGLALISTLCCSSSLES